MYEPRYLAGIVLFNRGDYFEAHDVWELLWQETFGEDRPFYQGLIQAAVGLCQWYKVAPERALLVIYDDLDLPFGALRLRERGSAGTHNGMKSVVEQLGSQVFPRVRVGISQGPPGRDAAKYVLGRFTREESADLPNVIARAADATETVLREGPADLDALLAAVMANGQSVEQNRRDCVAKIGENINVRRGIRLTTSAGVLGSYLHGTRIGVLVELVGGDAELAKDIAMHIAASRPLCVSADQVPAELIAKEKEIYAARAVAEGKPAHMIDKIAEGRLRKYFEEVTLLGQPFVKDPEQSVDQLLKSRKARVARFERFELGEGIEKKSSDFAAEVAAARGD